MEWAKDYQGKIVRAQRGAYSGFGLTCPTCGEHVYLRAGKERRPHFAHYSYRAKPDCEYYYPPPDVLQRVISRLSSNNSLSFLKRDSLRCGLFLAHRAEPVGFEIFLRIPSLASVKQLNGNLQIQHSRGVKVFTATQLTKAYMVPLSPTVPLMECTGTGDLLALSDHIMSQTNCFLHGMNLFVAAETGGRFLFTGEPLEWGRRYWVVTDDPVTPPDRVTAIMEWSRCGSLAQWHVYEAELPATLNAARLDADKKMLTEFFGRGIRPRQPRAYVVQPSPHHLAADGAYVYPQAPNVLYVRRTSKREVSVEGPPDMLADIRVTELADDWVQINGIRLGTQDVTILIDGVEQAVIRTEVCDLIQPDGLRAHTRETSWSLLMDTPLSSELLFSQEVRIECGSDRLAEHVAKINEDWILDGPAVMLPKNTDKTLRAGGFGEIRLDSSWLAKQQNARQESVAWRQKRLLPKEIWIDGLIRERHGSQMASLVRDFMANPSQGNLQKLGPILTSPLMAYIRAAVAHPR